MDLERATHEQIAVPKPLPQGLRSFLGDSTGQPYTFDRTGAPGGPNPDSNDERSDRTRSNAGQQDLDLMAVKSQWERFELYPVAIETKGG